MAIAEVDIMRRRSLPSWFVSLSTLAVAVLSAAGVARAQARDAAGWTAHVASEYDMTSDVTYLTAGGIALKLDVYSPRGRTAPNPVVLYFHGGGWAGGSRDRAVLRLLPYLERGFTVVNATYRGGRVAPAPAAVEDCRCALKWLVANAAQHKLDVGRIVLTGDSAGSHLALMSGLLDASAGFDRQCPEGAAPKVAAIVSWFGATDVSDLLEGPNAQRFAADWLGGQPDRAALARRLSPLTYARAGAPPVLTVHGDADPVVPYAHATRLHAELTKQGVRNELVTVPGGGHGGFAREQNERTYAAIRVFLGALGLAP
jgi:acetyl esterase/lipase